MRDVKQTRLVVYLAAPRVQAGRAEALAAQLRAVGYKIASKWHVDAEPLVDPDSRDVRAKVLGQNTRHLAHSDVVIALMDEGSPRATYAEIGWALAEGKHVIWMAPPGDDRDCIYDSHPAVARVGTIDQAISYLLALDAQPEIADGSRTTAPMMSLAGRLLLLLDARQRFIETRGARTFVRDPVFVFKLLAKAGEELRVAPGSVDWLTIALDVLGLARMAADEPELPQTDAERKDSN